MVRGGEANFGWPALLIALVVALSPLLAVACPVSATSPGFLAFEVESFDMGERLSGLAVLGDGRVAIWDGAAVVALDEVGTRSELLTPSLPLSGAVLAFDASRGELWIGDWSGAITRLPVGGGAPTTIAVSSGLGGIGFDPQGRAYAARLDSSASLSAVDPVSGALFEIYRDSSGLAPPAFTFMDSGALLVAATTMLGERLIFYGDAQVSAALSGAALTPAAGAPWSREYPDIAGCAAAAGGAVFIACGNFGEVYRAIGMSEVLVATACPPPGMGASSFLAAIAITSGWPALDPGSGATSARVALLSTRFDTGLMPFDASVDMLLPASGAGLICGDADGDGDVDILDALLVAQAAAGLTPALGLIRLQGDVDASGEVSVLDALRIAQDAAGIAVVLAC